MRRFIWTFGPKGVFGLILLVVFCFMFAVAILPHLLNPKGVLLLLALATPVTALAFTLPDRVYKTWECLPDILRAALLSVLAYATIVTVGHFGELYNFRLWLDFLLLRSATPWSSVHSVAMAGVAFAFATQMYKPPGPLPEDEERILSGYKLISREEALAALPRIAPGDPSAMFWGTFHLPESFGTQHFCIIGSSGSGKSTSLQLLMQSVLPKISRGPGRRALVYDAKRDIYATLLAIGLHEDQIIILNPFDRRCAAWDMAADITDPATADQIATILAPDEGDPHPFFPKAAQSLVGGLMEAYFYLAQRRWTFRDVVLGLRTDNRLKTILGRCPQTRHLTEKFLPGTGDTQHDIAATIENTMRRLAFVAAAWDRAKTSVSLDQWMRGESVLLLGSNPALQSTVQQLNAAIFHRVTQLVLRQPNIGRESGTNQTWFFLDELRRAGVLPNLPELLVEGRSKGACVAIGFQDIPGLYQVYKPNLANEIIGACRNKTFLKIADPQTAQYASEFFGKQEVEITRYSRSWGLSKNLTSGETRSTGISVSRTIHNRSVIPSAAFGQIKEANPQNGIGGYYALAEVRDPYPALLPGEFVDQTAPKPNPAVPNIIERPPEHQVLREWTEDDLQRLGLADAADALLPKTQHPRSKPPDAHPAEGDGLLSILPKRKL